MNNEKSFFREIIIRDVLIALFVAILGGVIVSIIVGEGRFAPEPASNPTISPAQDPVFENPPTVLPTVPPTVIVPFYFPDVQIVFERWPSNYDLNSNSTIVELWSVRIDGSGLMQLTAGSTDELASWSPNGTQLAFTRREPNIFLEIMLLDSHGMRP